jgi:hypothetical protein
MIVLDECDSINVSCPSNYISTIIFTGRLLGEDTKGVIIIRKSMDRQYNGKRKRTNTRCKTLHRKLKIEQHEPH